MIEEIIVSPDILEDLDEEKIRKISKELNLKIEKVKNCIRADGEPLDILKLRRIIFALSRKFDFSSSILLAKDDYTIEEINIRDYTKSRNRMRELRGRVIGEKGRAKRRIEEITNTKITICGKTVNIIGRLDDILVARKAIEMLLEGKKHATVYKFLEKIISTI